MIKVYETWANYLAYNELANLLVCTPDNLYVNLQSNDTTQNKGNMTNVSSSFYTFIIALASLSEVFKIRVLTEIVRNIIIIIIKKHTET